MQEKQTGDWNTTGEYRYDALGRRVRKVVTNKGGLNGTTRFLWGGDSDWQCLEELASDDDIVARFTYSPGYIDAVAMQERDLNADNDFGDTNEVVYYHASTLFSAYALSDASESVIERYRYDAYGSCTVLDADGSVDADGLSDVKNPYLFTSRRLDPESGLMQYRFREYSPVAGRFLQRDPVVHPDGANLYEYVGGRPGALLDPAGMSWRCCLEWGREWQKRGYASEDKCIDALMLDFEVDDPLQDWTDYLLGFVPWNTGWVAKHALWQMRFEAALTVCSGYVCVKDRMPDDMRFSWWGVFCPLPGFDIWEYHCDEGELYDTDDQSTWPVDPLTRCRSFGNAMEFGDWQCPQWGWW